MVEPPLAPIEPLLVAEIRQYRRIWSKGALTLAAGLWITVLIGIVSLPRADALRIGILAAAPGAPFAALLWVAGRRDPTRHRALRALRDRGTSVVWLYTRIRHGAGRLDELATALRAPTDRLRSVELTHQANVQGDYVDVAVVTLTNGHTFVFWVDPKAKGSMS